MKSWYFLLPVAAFGPGPAAAANALRGGARKKMWLGFVVGAALFLQNGCGTVPAVGPNLNLTKAAGNQYETAVAIDPNDNNRIFVVSRNEKGGLYTARSSDGGATWTSRLIAQMPVPAAGDIARAYGNASVAWDTFGNLFLAYLSQSSVSAPTYVCLSVSTDGGAMFYSPTGTGAILVLPINPPSLPLLGDQPTVTVGPGSAGFPGSIWVTYWTMGGIAVSGAGVSGLGVVAPFTSMQPIQPAAVNFGDIAVGPDGEVMVTYGPIFGNGGTIYTNVKPDGLGPGTFSTFTIAVPVNIGGFAQIPAQPNLGIDPEAGLAWDRTQGPHRGRVYLVYTDAPAVGSADTNIFVIYSDDMGTTWSTPVRVNDDTGTNSQFLPRISLDQSDGMIAVTWYDARNSPLNNTAQYFGAFSSDGGATFGANFQISSGTSNQANSVAVLKKADYGDYTGNAFVGGRLVPAWADNSNSTGDNPDGATNFDVYTAIVQAPTPLINGSNQCGPYGPELNVLNSLAGRATRRDLSPESQSRWAKRRVRSQASIRNHQSKCRRLLHLVQQPGAREIPVTFDGRWRDAQSLADLVVREPAKESQFHHLRGARIQRFQTSERPIEVNNPAIRRDRQSVRLVE
jgi:hypothetical protein